MKKFAQVFLYLIASGLVVFNYSCTTCQGNQNTEKNDIFNVSPIDEQLLDDFNKSKLIFYSLPSPLETAMLIKKAGASYNDDLLNNLSNVSKYNTNLKMALNLGIYGADMSYISLFDQMQNTLAYMGTSRRLAEQLGILGAIDENTIKKLEDNMNDRDVIMDIISETFMNSNAYLTENNRPAIAATVLVGGWIEGIYIASQLANNSVTENPLLIDRIVYQKLSLQTVLSLLETHKSNTDIQYLIERMNQLKVIFDEIKIVNKSKPEVETIPDQQMTIIRSEAETRITQEVFEKLVNKIAEIRTEFIS